MKANDLTIIPPEGMEAYQEGNKIKFRTVKCDKKELTYDYIAKKLFEHNKTYYIGNFANVDCIEEALYNYREANNCTSEKQARKLLAINKLMNVAKYLNGDWQPNWGTDDKFNYFIYIDSKGVLSIGSHAFTYSSEIYFKSRELAEQAISILGEETIRLALCTDW